MVQLALSAITASQVSESPQCVIPAEAGSCVRGNDSIKTWDSRNLPSLYVPPHFSYDVTTDDFMAL